MATIVKRAIGEHDIVTFTEVVQKAESAGTWPAGTKGTVISDFGDHKMIDISNDLGETLDMPTVPVAKLELVAAKYS